MVVLENTTLNKLTLISFLRVGQNSAAFQITKIPFCLSEGKWHLLLSTARQRSQNIVVTHPSTPPPIFCHHSLKILSPTLPKLMNWILLSPPPLSSDPDNPPKFETCTCAVNPLSFMSCKLTRSNCVQFYRIW